VSRPRLLDLFCGAGGAVGYERAGFDVIGVDREPQPFYPFAFVQGDALAPPVDLAGFDVIHASPPCQFATQMSWRWRRVPGTLAAQRPDLLTPTLAMLRAQSVPWIVENVEGARSACPAFRPTIKLHGGQFGLGVHRPRYFESSLVLLGFTAGMCPEPVGVYGRAPDSRSLYERKKRTRLNGHGGKRSVMRAPARLEEAQEAMGMDWADWHGTKEAIPPAYTEFLGEQLFRAVAR